MKKLLFFFYAIICYLIFFATFLYLIGFMENVSQFSFAESIYPLFSKTVDIGEAALPVLPSILVNLLLIALFGIQHSVMARNGFKQKWAKAIPLAVERSTYVLFTSIVLIVLYYFWQPVTMPIWNLHDSVIGDVFFILSLAGWGMVLISTFLINHFDLFGLRQPYLYSKTNEVEKLTFRTPGFYKMVRHPIYLGFLIAFWFAPFMTVGHFVFSMGMTIYIFIGIYHEEKDLIKAFGEKYHNYRLAVPKILPFSSQSKTKFKKKSRDFRFNKSQIR